MAEKFRLAVDLANVLEHDGKGAKILATLAWGDEVVVTERTEKGLKVELTRLDDTGDAIAIRTVPGFIKFPSKASGIGPDGVLDDGSGPAGHVLRADFVDVQQGDGAVFETPEGRVLLVDGGDNQLFARYLAARFPGSSAEAPKEVDGILITHGDADHFMGLTEIHASETNAKLGKRLFIHPQHVFHNGLVKRPGSRDEKEQLGATTKLPDGTVVITGLEDDPRNVDSKERNQPFNDWCEALDAWEKRGGKIAVQRLDDRVDGGRAFAFLDEGAPAGRPRIEVQVLGPIPVDVDGRPALKFLGAPTPRVGRKPGAPTTSGISASHAINGHSVILHVRYGNVRFLLAGDLNEEAEEHLTERRADDLRAEVLKVPHHGSAEYSAKFLKAVAPAVSVVSSGDESERKEFIHPRATLVAALGRHARAELDEPLVLITELAAFFAVEGPARTTGKDAHDIFAFSRRAFGIVKVRTNGDRLLVYTYSGKSDMKEAYAFTVAPDGAMAADQIRKC
jgi:Metallo-beta-lactamase superfamily